MVVALLHGATVVHCIAARRDGWQRGGMAVDAAGWVEEVAQLALWGSGMELWSPVPSSRSTSGSLGSLALPAPAGAAALVTGTGGRPLPAHRELVLSSLPHQGVCPDPDAPLRWCRW